MDSQFAPGRPSVRKLKGLGVTGVRLVARNNAAFFQYARELERGGIELAIVLTGESFTSQRYAAETAVYTRCVQPSVWLLGNEWSADLDASWPSSDARFVDFWWDVAPVLRVRQPDAKLYMGGFFSEPDIVNHVARVAGAIRPQADGVDLHLYNESVPEIITICRDVRALGLEVGIFEWNWADPIEIGGFESLLEEITDHSAWIPFAQEQIPDMAGLYRRDRLTDYGRAYRAALKRSR